MESDDKKGVIEKICCQRLSPVLSIKRFVGTIKYFECIVYFELIFYN